jgi:prolipoprotein diacylglyceryltransferase
VLAWVAATLTALVLRGYAPIPFPISQRQRLTYYLSLLAGASIGAFALGTANLWLSGMPGIGRSIEGALFGAIVGVEAYKAATGIKARTGAIFTLPLAVGIAVGRVGCFLAGMDDFTYGLPTGLPWGHDFGDGIPRHPVQLYEAIAMAGFATVYFAALMQRQRWPVTLGFPLVVLFYGTQRFIWEFLKPYGAVVGNLSLFHLTSIVLVVYALALLRDNRNATASAAGT